VLRYDVNCLPPQPTQTVTTLLLIAAAFLGGALNSLAGGGTLVTFPALLFAGLNPIDANASSVGALAVLFIISIYGGYFGGGIGFLMLAAFTLFGMRDINAMNGLKMALVGVMTITAIIAFMVANVVRWPETLPMFASSAVGSYMAAHWAQRLDQRLIKGFVIVLGAALTIYFAWRGV